MSPAEVEEIARRLFGEHWKGALARSLGLDYSTLWRQIEGDRISGPVEAAIRAWDLIFKLKNLVPPLEPGGEFRKPAPKRGRKLTAYAKAMLDNE